MFVSFRFLPTVIILAESRGGMVGTPAAYSASQEISRNLWKLKFYQRLQWSLPLFPILSKIIPFQYPHPHPIYTISILILISHLRLVFQLVSFPQVS